MRSDASSPFLVLASLFPCNHLRQSRLQPRRLVLFNDLRLRSLVERLKNRRQKFRRLIHALRGHELAVFNNDTFIAFLSNRIPALAAFVLAKGLLGGGGNRHMGNSI